MNAPLWQLLKFVAGALLVMVVLFVIGVLAVFDQIGDGLIGVSQRVSVIGGKGEIHGRDSLAAGSVVLLQGDTVATLSEVERMPNLRDRDAPPLRVYVGTSARGTEDVLAAEDSSLVAVLRSTRSGEPTVVELVRRARLDTPQARGQLYLTDLGIHFPLHP